MITTFAPLISLHYPLIKKSTLITVGNDEVIDYSPTLFATRQNFILQIFIRWAGRDVPTQNWHRGQNNEEKKKAFYKSRNLKRLQSLSDPDKILGMNKHRASLVSSSPRGCSPQDITPNNNFVASNEPQPTLSYSPPLLYCPHDQGSCFTTGFTSAFCTWSLGASSGKLF